MLLVLFEKRVSFVTSIAFAVTSVSLRNHLGVTNLWGLSLDDEHGRWNNHHTKIILDINCRTTLLTLVTQSVRASLEVTLEPILLSVF
jgi:hypothetical protein